MVLDSLGEQVKRIEMGMEAHRKKIKTKHHVEPRDLRRGERDRKRWERMEKKLRRTMKEHGRICAPS